MLYKLIFLTLINYCYADSQTLILSYYNNTNCSDTYFKQQTFSDNHIVIFGSYCRTILDEKEIEKNQNLNTCYLDNNTKTSYYYTCVYNVIDFFFIILFSTLVLSVCCTLIFSKKKSFNYHTINDFSYDTFSK